MSRKLVLVTGISGFIASHVANSLLDAGYRVRGTCRGAKAQQLKETMNVHGLEFIRVDDITSSDLTEALKDVYAIIHIASPLPGRAGVEDTLKGAKEGTLHVLRSAVKAGIHKLIITSSIGAMMEPTLFRGFSGETFNGSEWGSVTEEEIKAKANNPLFVYIASKILAEKAVWNFVEDHAQLDVATILPGFVYGPFAKNFPSPTAARLGTNGFIYQLITGARPPMCPPAVADVRDVAKAHVLALNVETKPPGHKRYVVNGGLLAWNEAAEHLRAVRPYLRVLDLEEYRGLPGPASKYDTKRAETELGITEWIDPRDTIVAAVDSLVEVQRTWIASAA